MKIDIRNGSERMNGKDMLIQFLNSDRYENLFQAIGEFFELYHAEFYASDMASFISHMQMIMAGIVLDMECATETCYEKGIYLRDYLEGKTWATEEDAKRNLQPQIDNARMIVDVCKRK